MASEIRANTLKNRVGLSTINISNTGIVVSGVSTFSGQVNVNDNMQFTAANPEIEFNNGGPRFRVPAANTLTVHSGGGLGSTNNEKLRIASDGLVSINGFSGTGLRLEGSGSSHQGIQLKTTDSSASVERNVFIDAVNETGVAVANMVGSVQADGGSSWTFDTQPTGNRTDRRQERFRINSAGSVGIGTATIATNKKLDVCDGIISMQAGHTHDTRIEFHRKNTGALGWIGIPNWSAASLYIYGPTATSNEIAAAYGGGAWNFYTGGVDTGPRLGITSTGNFAFGTQVDAGNTLRYFDIGNYNTGSGAGVVQRLLTTKSDGTSAAGLDIVKYKAGGAYLINYETIGSNGFITFSTGENAGAPTPRVTINGTGNLKIDTAGKGIDFSANSNLAGMTGEVLDHYETGTYVPTWSGAATPSYYRNGIDSGTSSNGLSYVRIGNQVTVTGSVFWTSATSIDNARPYMSLPFQARIYSVSGTIANYSLGVTSEIHYLNYDSTTSINMFIQTNNGLHGSFGDNTNGEMYFNITYMTY